MAEFHADDGPRPSLKAVVDGAKSFGLSDDEVWQALEESLSAVAADATVSEWLSELTEALVRHLLVSQRRSFAAGDAAHSEGRASSTGSSVGSS